MQDPGEGWLLTVRHAQLEALVEAMYLVAFADGDYSQPERERFARSVELLTDGRLSGNSFEHVIDRVVDALKDRGRTACVASLAERLDSAELREVALILASDMAAADGVLHPSERELLVAMAAAFGLRADATREAIDGFPAV